MIEYYDRNGHLIEEGAYLLYDKNEYFLCGIAKIVDNQLCFIYADGIDAMVIDQFKVPLCEKDLSKIQILDIKSFNASFDNKNGDIRYYDRFGLLIREKMGLFIGDSSGGNGGPIEKKNNDLIFDFGTPFEPYHVSLAKLQQNTHASMAVTLIPKQYLKQVRSSKQGV